MDKVLKLVNVQKIFIQGKQSINAVKEVNLEIGNGEFASLIGPSGSGKTTLIQIAGLLDSPTSGKVYINGIDASKADDQTRTSLRKDHIGFIFQFHHLLPEFSALENVAMPLFIKGIAKKEALEKAEEILHQVDLGNRVNHRPAELSGGQQQRVAIARAMISKPSLILADEPTGNLDSAMSVIIFDLLKNLTKINNIGCLIVTHNTELAKKTDRILSIKDGSLS